MAKRTLSDRLIALYAKLFPWKFRYRHGAPFIGALMQLKGNRVFIKDLAVFLNPNDKTATELFLVHANAGDWIWESYEISLFIACLEANQHSVAVDLVANYGAYTLSSCLEARAGIVESVIAVEPNRDTFACLSDSVAYNGFAPYVQLVNAAVVKDHNTESIFYPHDTFSAMSQTLSSVDPASFSEHAAPYKVRGVTLDGLLPELGLAGAGSLVIKIDIEGAEPDAFRGMEATLGSANGYQVFFELHPGALLSLGNDPLEFGRHLFALGVDVIAEVDQHEKVTKEIRDLAQFEALIEGCLTTTEMWKDYTNIFISKGLKVPFEIRG